MQSKHLRLDENTSERSEGNLIVSILKAVRIWAPSKLPLFFKIDTNVIQFDLHNGVIGLERREPAEWPGSVRITTTLDQPAGRLKIKYLDE